MNDSVKAKVEKYIGEKDHILASYKGKYFATQKRLFIYKKDGFEDYMYKDIISIKYEKHVRKSLLIAGILLLIIGIFSSNIPLLFFGFLVTIIAFIFKTNFYLIRTTGGDTVLIEGSRVPSETENFIKIIREHSG